jgi:hypothetical protein
VLSWIVSGWIVQGQVIPVPEGERGGGWGVYPTCWGGV